jgi:Zn-dependent protease with chaperone function
VDFFSHQDQARRNTGWLVFYFLITVVVIVLSVYFALITILMFSALGNEKNQIESLWNPTLFAAVSGLVITTIGAGSLYKTWQLSGDGHLVAVQLGGIKVLPNTRNLDERVLLNVVEEMAIASGTPVPPVYLLPNEEGINAFAAGTSPQNAVIGVTRGCLETLSRDELQGVIAHEFSHILNGDMKLNVRLIGLLHGILLIAMIGYFMFRIAAHLPTRSSSNDDSGKGVLAFIAVFFAIGFALVGIGYAGVFFANLIQSAVSRQREFLADASAVQFTRNPSGISGALQRIGGWKPKSVMNNVYSKEASHMFFGQGFRSSWFSTHPPLGLRIQRIDPSFAGKFSVTNRIAHSENDIVDPRTLGFQRSQPASPQQPATKKTSPGQPASATLATSAHQAALEGVEHFEKTPVDAVHHVGQPVEEHIEHAHRLIGELDPALVDSVHEPFGAVSIVYALLLGPNHDGIRDKQLAIIRQYNTPGLVHEIAELLPKTDALEVEQRLPLACMALPALDQLSDSQAGTLRTTVRQLIDADQKWTIFEFALHRFIHKRLVLRNESNSSPRLKDRQQLVAPFQIVLSTLAHLGGNVHADSAFQAAWSAWAKTDQPLAILNRDACTLRSLDQALNTLARATGHLKRNMLNAFSECIAFDRKATLNEIELLRVISDALDCPMPPVLDLPLAPNP